MDVNYYLAREQIELFQASAATMPGVRAAHQHMADHYRGMLDDYRDARVASASRNAV